MLCACVLSATMYGCSRSAAEHAAASTPPVSAFVAIARGRVDVEGGIVRIVAQRDGIVAALHGAIGDSIKAGDVLIELDATQAKIGADMARAELAQAEAQAAAQRAKSPVLQQRAARVDEASRAGAASGQAADDARQALTELNAEIAVANATVESARQKVKQAEYEVAARNVRAPVGGRLIARDTQVGAAVAAQPGAVLAQLLPEAPRIVRAELNEGFVALVKIGMSAQVQAEAGGSRSFTARVKRIGDVFGSSRLAEEGQESIDARDVECILELGADSDLRVGQRVQVRFLPGGP
jgi:macrolide-specific efflux system membrane fusion protein